MAWPSPGLRRVSVNSFGFGGTNAHTILDDAYHYLKARNLSGRHNTVCTSKEISHANGNGSSGITETSRGKQIFVWSSFDEGGTKRQAANYHEYLSEKIKSTSHRSDLLSDLAYTLAEKRTSFPWRTFTVADSLEALTGRLGDNDLPTAVRAIEAPRLGFVFTGQGAQWSAMGRELIAYPIFYESISQASEYFKSLGSDWDLLGVYCVV
jgi:acyl transferase domain-containing protein